MKTGDFLLFPPLSYLALLLLVPTVNFYRYIVFHCVKRQSKYIISGQWASGLFPVSLKFPPWIQNNLAIFLLCECYYKFLILQFYNINYFCSDITQGLTNIFYKRPHSKYSRLCGSYGWSLLQLLKLKAMDKSHRQ